MEFSGVMQTIWIREKPKTYTIISSEKNICIAHIACSDSDSTNNMYLGFFGQDRAESFREATTVCFSIVVTEFTDYDSRATGTFTYDLNVRTSLAQ